MNAADSGTTVVTQQYLSFRVGEELFALPIRHIREILEFGRLTGVPHMGESIRGVINLRGSVVPVLDLAARFGFGACEVGRRSCIVIVEIEDEDGLCQLGLVVDTVSEVLEIDTADIEPSPRLGIGVRNDFVAGMARRDDGFTIILALERVVDGQELAAIRELDAA
ncbi:Chemotaxis protein CheW [wastewater metagenome]|uniref:Chemotaxis protein CheW n=2 Tax=unclassified sequences TaxID=12908 RepID=A0A5B8R8Y2_9ZZZZ|nr:chemotaxis protein CheW [Arhodomonas sp. KWT]QEA05180.1 chemotaxis protein CheW [uncultured organism]